MAQDSVESQVQRNEDAAAELERAAGHLRRSAEHFCTKEIARAHAHAFATCGHMVNVQAAINEHAIGLAPRARLPGNPEPDA